MVRFIAIDLRYFVAALVVQPNEERSCSLGANPDGLVTVTLLDNPKQLSPNSKTEYDYVGFFGPKFLSQLDEVKVNGVDAKLGDSIDYGWTEVIARPMLAVLKAVHVAIPNWGSRSSCSPSCSRRSPGGRREEHEVDARDGEAQAGDGQAQGEVRRRQAEA